MALDFKTRFSIVDACSKYGRHKPYGGFANLADAIRNALIEKEGRDVEQELLQRDKDDNLSIKKGLEYAVGIGSLNALREEELTKECITIVNILGSNGELEHTTQYFMDQIPADIIISGGLIMASGSSSSGKGTVMGNLKKRLEKCGAKVLMLSNGNYFRSMCYLIRRYLEKKGGYTEVEYRKLLERDDFNEFMNINIIPHIKHAGGGTIKIELPDETMSFEDFKLQYGEGMDPMIPQLAGKSQHFAINFGKEVIKENISDGTIVLLEGREATLDYFDQHEIERRMRVIIVSSDPKGSATMRYLETAPIAA